MALLLKEAPRAFWIGPGAHRPTYIGRKNPAHSAGARQQRDLAVPRADHRCGSRFGAETLRAADELGAPVRAAERFLSSHSET